MSVALQSYSLELKAQAVRMAVEDGLGIKETGRRLSIPSGTLAGWVAKVSKRPNAHAPGEQIVQAAEVKRLEKENKGRLAVSFWNKRCLHKREQAPIRVSTCKPKLFYFAYHDGGLSSMKTRRGFRLSSAAIQSRLAAFSSRKSCYSGSFPANASVNATISPLLTFWNRSSISGPKYRS